ncbi:MAG: ABC transporter ATP-binding protein [Candidatus Magnetomorum sp.]|nr:ABC transporter ATP-binding protein [Candidatus Magnetomorum sp.]
MTPQSTDNIYELKHIQHFYGHNKALDISHLCIPRGRRFGVAGPNGSGKSTLLKLLAFCESPTKGTLLLNGKPAHMFSPSIRCKVSMLPQTSYLLNRTVAANIAYGLKLRHSTKNFNTLVMEALDSVGLNAHDFVYRRNHELSGGEARRVALAARLVLKPDVLVLDEPTAGIDAESTVRIQDSILDISKKLKTTLIISSHDHEWLSDICETQVFMFQGRPIGTEKKNIIFGPFEPVSAYKWQKIEDGQKRFIVPTPPSPHAIALIDPGDIHVFSEKPPLESDHIIIEGQITRLFVIPYCSAINLSIRLGQRHLLAQVKKENFKFFPGQRVYAVYKMGNVQWYDPE